MSKTRNTILNQAQTFKEQKRPASCMPFLIVNTIVCMIGLGILVELQHFAANYLFFYAKMI